MWRGEGGEISFHLVGWDHNSLPKRMDGWSIKNLEWFNNALCQKHWRIISGKSIWRKVCKAKYIRGINYADWFILEGVDRNNLSIIWICFLKKSIG